MEGDGPQGADTLLLLPFLTEKSHIVNECKIYLEEPTLKEGNGLCPLPRFGVSSNYNSCL